MIDPRSVIVVVIALCAAVPARAATIPVTTTSDVVSALDGQTSLREAVSAANGNAEDDVITLAADATYAVTLCASGAITHTAPDDLTIAGSGASITQTCTDTQVLAATGTGSMLTLTGLHLIGGPGSGATVEGAGVRAVGRMTLDGVTVSGINAGSSGSVLWSAGDDPGIDVILEDSALTGSDASGIKLDGGGVSLTGSTITGQAFAGVGLIDGSPLIVTGSDVSGNGGKGLSTTGQGDNVATITDSVIADNGDTGLFCQGCELVSVSGSTIRHNGYGTAGGGGGGVEWTVDQASPADADRKSVV